MKVVILTSDWYLSPKIAIKTFLENPLLKKYGIKVVGIVSASNFQFNKKTYLSISKFIKRSGLKFFLKNAFLNIWQSLTVKFAKYFIPNEKRIYFNIEELAEMNGASYLALSDINSKESKKFIKKLKPNYLVSSLLLQIIDKEMLNIPTEGSINFHPALTQIHRGTFSSFWTLLKNWRKTGATVHFMTEKVDDGEIIIQKHFFTSKSDTINCINEKTAKLGGNLLAKALVKIKKKKKRTSFLKKLGGLFHHPSKKDIKNFKKNGGALIKIKDFFKI